MNYLFRLLSAAFLALISSGAEAIEISMSRGNAISTILVTGSIEVGDAERFERFWEENAFDSWGFVVAFDSPGGNLLEGLAIGRFIREAGADTEVQRYEPDTAERRGWVLPGAECYSACALAFMGGLKREIAEGSTIGFHQFYGGVEASTDDAMELTQHMSAVIAGYLREMGAKPELFELLSGTSPDQMFVPTSEEIRSLSIVPLDAFHDFQLMPRGEYIVATAVFEAQQGSLQRVVEIETQCWDGQPLVSLYAMDESRGLSAKMADPETTDVWGFRIDTDFGSFEYGNDSIVLYPGMKILASMFIQPHVARALGRSSKSKVVVNSPTVSGVHMSGDIVAPSGGDAAILASFRDCI